MKTNYDTVFSKTIEEINKNSLYEVIKPRLLLHVCCAPCSSAVLERLIDVFATSIYFFNPNIHPEAEYFRRLDELKSFLQRCETNQNIEVHVAPYKPEIYFDAVETEKYPHLKIESERGERCKKCYNLRIQETAAYALENDFNYFTTALSISPHKDATMINEIGEAVQKSIETANGSKKSPQYLFADFKKQNGYKRSLEISKEYNLYRQDYCGCVFSMRKGV